MLGLWSAESSLEIRRMGSRKAGEGDRAGGASDSARRLGVAACLREAVNLVANVCYFGANFWLGIWVEAADRDENISVSYYLGVFASFIFVELFCQCRRRWEA